MADRTVESGAATARTAGLLAAAVASWPAIALAAIVGAILAANAPVLGEHYFIGDDFVPLADMASRSTPAYLRDLFVLNDTTPNWRFLTGLAYLGLYRTFGLHAAAFFATSLLVHIATAGLVYRLVRRATGAVSTGLLAAALFGLTPAHAHTIGLVTAFNNILSAFFVLLSLTLLDEGLERRRGIWLAGAALAFLGAVAANESAAVLAPVPGLFALRRSDGGWRRRSDWPMLALATAPFLLIGASTLMALGACDCTEATRGGVTGWGGHMNGNAWIYLGRLLYPVGLEFPGHVGTAHLAAGIALLLVMLAALAFGPALLRVAVVFLVLALLPYLPIRYALAPRYVYMASIPFAMLAALCYTEVVRFGQRLTSVAPAAFGVIAIGVLALYSWQTWEQNGALEPPSDDWRALVRALERSEAPPAGSRVYLRGAPITEPGYEFVVLPAVGEVVWGDVEVFSITTGTPEVCTRAGAPTYVYDSDGSRFVQTAVIAAEGGVKEPYRFPPPIPAECDRMASLP